MARYIGGIRAIAPVVMAPATAIGAERAAERRDDDEARRQPARWTWGYRAIVLLLIVATWDMVTQPGL